MGDVLSSGGELGIPNEYIGKGELGFKSGIGDVLSSEGELGMPNEYI